MLDTGAVARVDLNADLGEADAVSAADLAILDSITSVSIACGFHAGNRAVIRATADAALARGVTIGAHVSYRDRQGFGRRDLDVSSDQLSTDLDEQLAIVTEAVGSAGGSVAYVKPHGALYNRMSRDPAVAAVVVEAVRRYSEQGLAPQQARAAPSCVLLTQAGSVAVDVCRRSGLDVATEAFPDRGYQPDGRLTPRGEPGAMVDDPVLAANRALDLVLLGGIDSVDGSWVPVVADSLCIHGDTPGAEVTARAVRARLSNAGIEIRAFAGNGTPDR